MLKNNDKKCFVDLPPFLNFLSELVLINMVKHAILPIPDATVGKVLGLVEVIYSYGGQSKISFLSDELRMPIDELGAAIDMAELLEFVKVKEGMITLTVYGEAVCLGMIDDKKRIIKRKILAIGIFKFVYDFLKKKGSEKEDELFKKIKIAYSIQDKERFHKLFINWGTYSGLFEYDSQTKKFNIIS